jgi:hypothetical protein
MKIKFKQKLNNADVYSLGKCIILSERHNGMLHLSISHAKRNPTYEEIKFMCYELAPNDCTMAMIFPHKEEFVNLHKYCFHLYEIETKRTKEHKEQLQKEMQEAEFRYY